MINNKFVNSGLINVRIHVSHELRYVAVIILWRFKGTSAHTWNYTVHCFITRPAARRIPELWFYGTLCTFRTSWLGIDNGSIRVLSPKPRLKRLAQLAFVSKWKRGRCSKLPAPLRILAGIAMTTPAITRRTRTRPAFVFVLLRQSSTSVT